MKLRSGAELYVLKDWMDGGQPHLYFDGISIRFGYSPKMEK